MASCSKKTISYNNESAYTMNYQCTTASGPSEGGEGTTYWELNNGLSYTISPYSSITASFTLTEPACYVNDTVCNIYFSSGVTSSSNTSDIYLNYYLNMNNAGGSYIYSNDTDYFCTQAYDVAITGLLDHAAENYFSVYNNSSATVSLQHFEIIRNYSMNSLVPRRTR